MEGTVEHVHFLLENCEIATVRTVLYVEDWVLVMFYLLYNAGVFDIEDSQNSRLKTSCEKESLGVRREAKAEVIWRITEFVSLFKFFRVPKPNS
jgi:hypothetical protein